MVHFQRRKSWLLFFTISSFAIAMLSDCAGQRPPEGGPVDTVPPEIVSVYPLPNTTHFTGKRFRLEFSKYVDRRSVEESIFISPPVGELQFDWSGTEVEAEFRKPLRKNTTYVVTVGTDVVDIHNKNRMAKSFSLAFSTGDIIDKGKIEGKVYDIKPEGIMIFAYRLNDMNRDTLNPMTLKPDYITQTGTDGDYRLQYLAFGIYRVFAVRDEYRNLLYDPEIDAMSTAVGDIQLDDTDSVRTDLNFQLGVEDTTAPRLVEAVANDNRHVVVTFSEPIAMTSIPGAAIAVTDTTMARSLTVRTFFLHLNKPSVLTLVTDPQEKDSIYDVSVRGVKDLAGHLINSRAFSKTFEGSGVRDTTLPRIIFSSLNDTIGGAPLDKPIRFDFDDALDSASLDSGMHLMNKDSTEVPATIEWIDPASFQFVPQKPLKPNTEYSVWLKLNILKDYDGNHLAKDSTKIIKFTTIDPDKLSSIEGTVLDPDTTLVNRYIVVARNITTRTQTVQIVTRRGKTFLIPQLSEGRYKVEAFQDDKNTGEYFSGKPFPFLPSERFAVYADTIKIRARWPVDGLVIQMPSE
jgi:Bacterial Ig-like domain